jgi:RND superfamily putative drug exporter
MLAWFALAVGLSLVSPSLTRLAAEGQAHLLPEDSESALASKLVRKAWPDQWLESIAVVMLERGGGLTDADHDYAKAVAERFEKEDRPRQVLRVLGPNSAPEIAGRLISSDRTTQLVLLPMESSFVAPSTAQAIARLQTQIAQIPVPGGLTVQWTGDAVVGRDYMRSVQTSLDRAAVVTIFLLLAVLLAVYRSFLLALVPLVTIGVGLAISRAALAWMTVAGWPISPLVELFLVVILFGCGTDFCLFLSWRFGEHWNANNPSGAMRATLRRSLAPLLTSAGTVIAGLTLMGTNRFKLFSSTGPSVALGLAITLLATLTLTPAMLVLLAKHRPKSFAGLTAPSSGFRNSVGHRVLSRPILTWLGTLAFMLVPAVLGINLSFVQDMFSELPYRSPSVVAVHRLEDKFGAGSVAPLTVVVKSEGDLRESEGLAMIDDLSRLLSHQRALAEVRSATQPLGSPKPLEQARLASRLQEINSGFSKIIEGAEQLETGLNKGAGKIRTAMMLEEMTGLPLTGSLGLPADAASRDALTSGLGQATSAMLGIGPRSKTPADPPKNASGAAVVGPRDQMLKEMAIAAQGANQIAEGASRARQEITSILTNPVGRQALDRLLVTPENVRDNPDLKRSLDAYISEDGHLARLDASQSARILSSTALDQVQTLRRRTREYLGEEHNVPAISAMTGANAEAADVRALTRSDQVRTWIIVPLGVFIILVIALRDFWACLNLVATMVLTYLFALGVTHLVFVNGLGAAGLDWKVPYFLFVLLVAVGVDYNVFLMARLQEESAALGLRQGIQRAVAQTGGLISSAAAITAASFASFMSSPLGSLRQLGFALVVGILIDAVLVRPVLVPCGQWLMYRRRDRKQQSLIASAVAVGPLSSVVD